MNLLQEMIDEKIGLAITDPQDDHQLHTLCDRLNVRGLVEKTNYPFYVTFKTVEEEAQVAYYNQLRGKEDGILDHDCKIITSCYRILLSYFQNSLDTSAKPLPLDMRV